LNYQKDFQFFFEGRKQRAEGRREGKGDKEMFLMRRGDEGVTRGTRREGDKEDKGDKIDKNKP